MTWPYDSPDYNPDSDPFSPDQLMPIDHPQAQALPPFPEPDYMAELAGPQQPMPNDFMSRIVQGQGSHPFPDVHFTSKTPHGGLMALLAMASGFGNAKAAQSASKMRTIEQGNQRAREAAKTLADWRHEQRNIELRSIENRKNAGATRAAEQATHDKNTASDRTYQESKTASDRTYQESKTASDRAYDLKLLNTPPTPERIAVVRALAAAGRDPNAGGRFVPSQDENGNMVWTRVSEGAPVAGKKPSAMERENLISDVALIEQTRDIDAMFKPEFVGPAAGRLGAFGIATGLGLRPGEADFRDGLATYRNAVINRLSGTAVGVKEAIRMKQQIPDENNPPEVFRARIKKTRQNIIYVAKKRRELYAATGLDLSGIPEIGSPTDKFDHVDANGKTHHFTSQSELDAFLRLIDEAKRKGGKK